ncbi:MAG: hypothetical protein JW904_01970 [Spirochaetales bacterium]|nr:hypothetical protein [Spirochaetales bacterium]
MIKRLVGSNFIILIVLILFFAVACVGSDDVVEVIPGVKSWVLPATPNGLEPTQVWFSIGGAPDGGIYIGASDHTTNSALYRIDVATEKLELVGDAKSASRAANNWLENETAEKFHMRPIYYKGRVYVATTDYSDLNDRYVQKRGFHWYAYDTATKQFLDLSATEPGGVAGKHASIMATALDEPRGLLYGLETPRGHLFQYDIAKGSTKDLGRPDFLDSKYYNAGRYIWCDNEGRVYFTLSRVDTVMCWDPKTGFSTKKDWILRSKYSSDKNIRIGQWTKDGQRCYVADYEANFYLFDNKDKSFIWIGQGEGESSHFSRGRAFRIRVLNVTDDESTLYFANDDSEQFSLFEFDLEIKETRRLCYLSQIDSRLGDHAFYNRAGNDSWDSKGRFYIASFGQELGGETTEVIVTRIDPEAVKEYLNK